MFSSYFRDELGRRGLIPKRKRKPTPKKPKTLKAALPNPPDPPARAHLASTSRHQDTRSLPPISRSHSPIASTSRLQDPASLEELISATRSPVPSTSFQQDTRPIEELILGLFVTPGATPPVTSTLRPPYSRSSTLSVERLLLDDIVSSPPPEGRERQGDGMAAVLPQ